MTLEKFIEETQIAYKNFVRESDGLADDTPVGLPAKFSLDVKYHKLHGKVPQEIAELIYRAETCND